MSTLHKIQRTVSLYFRDHHKPNITMPGKPSGTLTEEVDTTTRRGSRGMPKFPPMPKRSSTRLSEIDGLDNPERVRLLGIIDQFRELGVSEDISLPQVSPQVESLY